MLRIIAISLVLVLSIGMVLPLANEAHGIRQSVQVHQRRHRRHSRAWWRRHRARLRQRRSAAEALAAHRSSTLALPKNIPVGDLSAAGGPVIPVLPENSFGVNTLPTPAAATAPTAQPTYVVPSAQPAYSVSNGQTRPRVVGNLVAAVKTPAAKLPGQMSLAVVALSRPNPVFLTSREEKNMLAGVAVADLRRIVIDKMVTAGGWVTNDFVRDVNGHRVFVVMARTPGDTLTPEKAWTFYFTEAGGRIYGLTTDSPLEFADRMSNEAERYMEMLRSKAEPLE